jgi:hypothetical protein
VLVSKRYEKRYRSVCPPKDTPTRIATFVSHSTKASTFNSNCYLCDPVSITHSTRIAEAFFEDSSRDTIISPSQLLAKKDQTQNEQLNEQSYIAPHTMYLAKQIRYGRKLTVLNYSQAATYPHYQALGPIKDSDSPHAPTWRITSTLPSPKSDCNLKLVRQALAMTAIHLTMTRTLIGSFTAGICIMLPIMTVTMDWTRYTPQRMEWIRFLLNRYIIELCR